MAMVLASWPRLIDRRSASPMPPAPTAPMIVAERVLDSQKESDWLRNTGSTCGSTPKRCTTAGEAPTERMKVTVYILDRNLRADGLKVAVFRQTKSADVWVDAQVAPDTAIKLEDAILTRARELRLASGGS